MTETRSDECQSSLVSTFFSSLIRFCGRRCCLSSPSSLFREAEGGETGDIRLWSRAPSTGRLAHVQHRNISSDSEDQLGWIKGAVHSENKLCQYKLHRVKIQPLLSHDALQTARHHGVSLNSLKATDNQKVFFISDREHLAAASSRLQFSTFL